MKESTIEIFLFIGWLIIIPFALKRHPDSLIALSLLAFGLLINKIHLIMELKHKEKGIQQ